MSSILIKLLIIFTLAFVNNHLILNSVNKNRILTDFSIDDNSIPFNKAICKLSDNNFVIAWSYMISNTTYGINAYILFTSSLTKSSLINIKENITSGELSMACLQNGGFVISWISNFICFASIYENVGTIRKSEIYIADYSLTSTSPGISLIPKISIAALASGDFIAVFNTNGLFARIITAEGNLISSIITISSIDSFSFKTLGLSNGQSIVVWIEGNVLYFRMISYDGILTGNKVTVSSAVASSFKIDASEIPGLGFIFIFECRNLTRICFTKFNYSPLILLARSILYQEIGISMNSPTALGLQESGYALTFNYIYMNKSYIASVIYDRNDMLVSYDEISSENVYRPVYSPNLNGVFSILYENPSRKLNIKIYPYCLDILLKMGKPDYIDFKWALISGFKYDAYFRINGPPAIGSLIINDSPFSSNNYYSLDSRVFFSPDSADSQILYSIKLSSIPNYEMTCSLKIYFICYSSCRTCDAAGNSLNHLCIDCKMGFFPLSDVTSQCYLRNEIVPGYYYDSFKFQKCPNYCSKCSDSETCIECLANFYFYRNICLSQCPVDTYIDTSTSILKCVGVCPDLYYPDITSQKCNSCPDRCTKCDMTGCLKCDSTSYLDTNSKRCVGICSDGFYPDNSNSTCSPCLENCIKCLDFTSCNSCKSSHVLYLNSKCVVNCPIGFYKDPVSNECNPCFLNCIECTNSTNCSKCNQNNFLLFDTCYVNCPQSYYANKIDGTCQKCMDYCESCVENNSCNKCVIGYFLDVTNNCKKECGSYFYKNTLTGRCENCINYCEECLNGFECTKCISNYFLLSNFTCSDSCLNGFYSNYIDRRCTPCISSCNTCENSYECISCSNGFYINSLKNCVKICDDEYYGNDLTKICEKCLPDCKQCQNSKECIKCREGTFLQSNKTCDIKCPDSFFLNTTSNECSSCSLNCQLCDNFSQCRKCQESFFLNSLNECTQDCGEGYFKNMSTLKCHKCSPFCSVCKNEFECIKCQKDYLLLSGNTCGDFCPVGFYGNSSGSCLSCKINCEICSNSDDCFRCKSGYFLNSSNVCVTDCDLGFYEDIPSGLCNKCIQNCERCDNNYECLKCQSGSYMMPNFECVERCSSGFYSKSDSQMCNRCSQNCDICENPTSCTKCSQGFFYNKIDKKCVSFCGFGKFGNRLTGTCEICIANCLECDNFLQCVICDNGFYLQPDGSCSDTCPERFYKNSQTNSCERCPDTCSECSNYITCTNCIPNIFLYESKSENTKTCVSNCPAGYFGYFITKRCEVINDLICNNKNPCRNSGSCYIINNSAVCVCKLGYIGQYCEIKINDGDGGDNSENGSNGDNTDNSNGNGNNNNSDNGSNDDNTDNSNGNGNNNNSGEGTNNEDDSNNIVVDPSYADELLQYANQEIEKMLSGEIPPDPGIIEVTNDALVQKIDYFINSQNPDSKETKIYEIEKEINVVKTSIESFARMLVNNKDVTTEPVLVTTDLFSLQIYTVGNGKRFLPGISSNEKINTTIVEANECYKEIRRYYKLDPTQNLLVKQIEFSQRLNLTSLYDQSTNTSNAIIFEIYNANSKKKFDQFVCNNVEITIRSPNKMALHNFNNTKYKTLKSVGIDIYDSDSDAFGSRCFILKDPFTGRDTSVNYRIQNYFEKTVVCPTNCNYEGIDENEYVICKCNRLPHKEEIMNTFINEDLDLKSSVVFGLLSCGSIAFQQDLFKNIAFYISTLIAFSSFIFCAWLLNIEIKHIHNKLAKVIYNDCQYFKKEQMGYEDYFNYRQRDKQSRTENNLDTYPRPNINGNLYRNRDIELSNQTANPPINIKINEYLTFNDKKYFPSPVGGVSGEANLEVRREIDGNNINQENNSHNIIGNSDNLDNNNQNIQNEIDNNSILDKELSDNRPRRIKKKKQDKIKIKKKSKKQKSRREEENPNYDSNEYNIPSENDNKNISDDRINFNYNSNNINNNNIPNNVYVKNVQINYNFSGNNLRNDIKKYFEFKGNEGVMIATDISTIPRKHGNNIISSEQNQLYKNFQELDESKSNLKLYPNVYEKFPDHQPTIRDYLELSTKEAVNCDKRKFKEIFLFYLVENHVLLKLIYKVSTLIPTWIRILLLFLNIQIIFGLNAVFFTDYYIQKRAKDDSSTGLLYSVTGEFAKFFYTMLFTFILMNITEVIAAVPKIYREQYNEALKTRDSYVIEKAYRNLCIKIRIKRIVLLVTVITAHVVCWYYSIVFCGIFSTAASGWVMGSIIGLIFYMSIVLITICFLKTAIRLGARKYKILKIFDF